MSRKYAGLNAERRGILLSLRALTRNLGENRRKVKIKNIVSMKVALGNRALNLRFYVLLMDPGSSPG